MAIDGEAVWSAGRQEGSCRLIDLSAGGVGITEPKPVLPVGTQCHMCLIIGDLRFESVPVESVRISEGGFGLRFRNISDELRERIYSLVHDLIDAS